MSEKNKPKYIFNNKFSINKLIKTLEYEYIFENVYGFNNWPVAVIPRSGSFIATSKTQQIEPTIIFCTNTGVCDSSNPDILPYKLDYSCGLKNKDLLFANIRLKVNEKNTNDHHIYSSGQYIECIDCLSTISGIFSGNMDLNKDSSSYTKIVVEIEGLVPGQIYDWSYEKIASNWPVTISPLSGSFVANYTNYNVDSIVGFCKNSSCSGSQGYLDFVSDHLSDTTKYVSLNFAINSNDHCYFDNGNSSLMITCNDCITRPRISFSNDTLVLKNNCENIEILLSGLEPYTEYNYYFSTHYANWPMTISPISGSFITSNNISLTIPFKVAFCGSESLCSGDPNLIDYAINYNRLYTDTSCEKYAYIQYNLLEAPNFSIQNNQLNYLSNPTIQSDLLSIFCTNCLGSGISQIPQVNTKIEISTTSGTMPIPIISTGTGGL
jgi:hypothetical protein